MGNCHSRNNGASPLPPPNPYEAELRSYESACRSDPAVQSFDDSLRRHTGELIANLANSGRSDLLSFYSLKDIVHYLLETNKETFSFILQSQSDIWQNPALKSLVKDYFANTLQTLDFCAALQTGLSKLNRSRIAVQAGLDRVEDGSLGNVLEYFAEFKEAGDPFEEFFVLFNAVKNKHEEMLSNLEKQKRKLDRKIESLKAWRKISSVIFASIFVVALVCGVVAAAMAAPPAAAAAATAASSLCVGGGGKWIKSMWKKSLENQQKQKKLVETMEMGTKIAFEEIVTIRILVESLKLKIKSAMDAVGFALIEEDAVRVVVDDVRKHLEALTKGAEDLKRDVDKCTENVSTARALVLQRIINHHPNEIR